MVKSLAWCFVFSVAIVAEAQASVPNCFTEAGVQKGIFRISPKSQGSTEERRALLNRVEELGLSVTDVGPGGSWLAQVVRAVELSSTEQATLVQGLQRLLADGAIEGVECNRTLTTQ